ncbi:MAG: hypothetical protein C0601_12270 [Candidatus Muiribacterium halophilum]|uniref:PPM-type phosphatase domain-containing protein n=1 Tax=Muiribacterium halophilum TaxID=2053465 RepID=A0A2N5ZAW6_MUIH1|nr:MAG: hypothetical protein C0601_12270 [Candidatus Muirbacterium halophilum]
MNRTNNIKKIFFDTNDDKLFERVKGLLSDQNIILSKRYSKDYDYCLIDYENSRRFDLLDKDRIVAFFSLQKNKRLAKDLKNSAFFSKPFMNFEEKIFYNHINQTLSSSSDILSAVYITSKQLEKINNDFRERIKDLSDSIGKSFIVDTQFFLDEIINIIIDYLSESIGAKRVSVILIDKKEKNDLLYNIDIKDQKVFKKLYLVQRGKVTEELLEKPKSLFIKDIEKTKYSQYMNNLNIYETKSFIAVPVRFQKNVVAVIYLTDKERGNFKKEDLNNVEIIAGSLERFFTQKVNNFEELLKIAIQRETFRYDKSKLVKDLTKTATLLEKTQEELRNKSNELNILYSINTFVRNTVVAEELLKMIVDTIIYSMKVNRASVLLISDDGEGDLLVSGIIGKNRKRVENLKLKKRGRISKDIIKHKRSYLVCSDDEKSFKSKYSGNYSTGSFVAVPVKIKNNVVAIINVSDRKDGKDFNEDDKKVLEILANQTAITIENFRLSSQLIEKEKVSHELNIARDIQMKLLPHKKLEGKGFSVDFRCIPAKEVGGDYVDYIDIDEKHKGLIIADVSGKGVPASLLMVMLRTLIRSIAYRELSPSSVMDKVNTLIMGDIDTRVFVTVFYAVVDVENHIVRYCNAGHNYPIIVRNNKIVEELHTNDVVVGFFDNYSYHEDMVKLQKGDMMFLYTDGLVEAMNEKGKIFGSDRLQEMFKKNHKNIFDFILKKVREFKKSESFDDDLTVAYYKVEE